MWEPDPSVSITVTVCFSRSKTNLNKKMPQGEGESQGELNDNAVISKFNVLICLRSCAYTFFCYYVFLLLVKVSDSRLLKSEAQGYS